MIFKKITVNWLHLFNKQTLATTDSIFSKHSWGQKNWYKPLQNKSRFFRMRTIGQLRLACLNKNAAILEKALVCPRQIENLGGISFWRGW